MKKILLILTTFICFGMCAKAQMAIISYVEVSTKQGNGY